MNSSLAPSLRSAALVLAVGSSMACGDGLVGADYEGEPLYKLAGHVRLHDIDPEGDLPEGELRVALVWADRDPEAYKQDFIDPIEQQTVATARFPAQYDLALYTPPSPAALGPRDGIAGGDVAVGALLMYIDTDGDRTWSGNIAALEPLVGGAYDRVLVYAPQPVSGVNVGGQLDAGYHVMKPAEEMPCQSPPPNEGMALTRVDDRRVDLQLGMDYEHLLLDLDCDENSAEWCAWCPPLEFVLAQLARLCEPGADDAAASTRGDDDPPGGVPSVDDTCELLRQCLACDDSGST